MKALISASYLVPPRFPNEAGLMRTKDSDSTVLKVQESLEISNT
jgi:hypothetical protein